MYYVVMTADRKFVRDMSDNRFAALFTTPCAAQRVADHLPGARVMRNDGMPWVEVVDHAA